MAKKLSKKEVKLANALDKVGISQLLQPDAYTQAFTASVKKELKANHKAKVDQVLPSVASPVKHKVLAKKEVMKLKAGAWIELWFNDAPNSVALLLDRPVNEKGDVSLNCLYLDCNAKVLGHNFHATHNQVVRTVGHLVVPTYTA